MGLPPFTPDFLWDRLSTAQPAEGTAVRRAVQRSQHSVAALARLHGIDRKTVAKWRKRTSTEDAPVGPTTPRSTVLSVEDKATIVAFRRHTLLPLDDCLYAL